MILIHSVLAFPFVVRSVRPVLANLDTGAARSRPHAGRDARSSLSHVELPLIAGGVFVALALGFGISVAEMSATMMLARPGLVTMPVSVYRFLASRDFQAASAMAVVLVLVTGGAFAAIEGFMRSGPRTNAAGGAKPEHPPARSPDSGRRTPRLLRESLRL